MKVQRITLKQMLNKILNKYKIELIYFAIFTVCFSILILIINDSRKNIYRSEITFDITDISSLYNYSLINDIYNDKIYVDIFNWVEKKAFYGKISENIKNDVEIRLDIAGNSENFLTLLIESKEKKKKNQANEEFLIIFNNHMQTFIKPIEKVLESLTPEKIVLFDDNGSNADSDKDERINLNVIRKQFWEHFELLNDQDRQLQFLESSTNENINLEKIKDQFLKYIQYLESSTTKDINEYGEIQKIDKFVEKDDNIVNIENTNKEIDKFIEKYLTKNTFSNEENLIFINLLMQSASNKKEANRGKLQEEVNKIKEKKENIKDIGLNLEVMLRYYETLSADSANKNKTRLQIAINQKEASREALATMLEYYSIMQSEVIRKENQKIFLYEKQRAEASERSQTKLVKSLVEQIITNDNNVKLLSNDQSIIIKQFSYIIVLSFSLIFSIFSYILLLFIYHNLRAILKETLRKI